MPRRGTQTRPAPPPLWTPVQRDRLHGQLHALGLRIAVEDRAAAAGDAQAAERAHALRIDRLRLVSVQHSSDLRCALGLAKRMSGWAAGQPAEVVDALAAHLSPVALEDAEGGAADAA
jgi:hypothetical protein